MPTKISALSLPANDEMLLPLVGGFTQLGKFPIVRITNVSNRGPNMPQIFQNGRAQLTSAVVNLKVAATTTITVPAGFRFYPEECYVILTSLVLPLVDQPVLSWGITGNNTKYQATLQMTQLTAQYKRERVQVTGTDGETSLTATVDTIANAGTFSGRFGFSGLLLTE